MSHLKFHYLHTVRPIMIDRYHVLKVQEFQTIYFSISSKLLLKNDPSLLFTALQVLSGKEGVINRVKRSLSEFGIKEGMLIGGSSSLSLDSSFLFLDYLLFYFLPHFNKRGVLGTKGDFHVGFKPIEMESFGGLKTMEMDFSFGLTLSLQFQSGSTSCFLASSLLIM